MATATSSRTAPDSFRTVPGDQHSEVGHTLAEPVPQALSLVDQLGLWGNLGVSLLGFTGAIFVLQPGGSGTPELSLAAGLCAIVVGTLLGTTAVALSGLPGARTGAPAMVLLRGLFGAGLSYLPTVLNILQCLGWGIFELVTIATAAHTVAPALPRWGYVLIAGAATGLLAVRPLGAIRILRRYVTSAVIVVLGYLFIQLLRHPLPALSHGTWSGYWAATDTVVAAAISFAPLAADYTRHSRSQRAAFAGTLVGYSVTQVLCYVIGLLALVTVARNPGDIYGAFIALPAGAIGFAILAARELDQSFANVYSTAVSTQNLRPLWDRRVLATIIAAGCTAGALLLNIADYENFLVLLGSVFVPMFAVLVVDFFVLRRGRWDLSAHARARWPMLLPWAAGFVMYQLINPGYIGWWVAMWGWIGRHIGFTAQSWMSASILSFLAAALATLLIGATGRLLARRTRRPVTGEGAAAPGLVHGMGNDLVAPDWPALDQRGSALRAGQLSSRPGRGESAGAARGPGRPRAWPPGPAGPCSSSGTTSGCAPPGSWPPSMRSSAGCATGASRRLPYCARPAGRAPSSTGISSTRCMSWPMVWTSTGTRSPGHRSSAWATPARPAPRWPGCTARRRASAGPHGRPGCCSAGATSCWPRIRSGELGRLLRQRPGLASYLTARPWQADLAQHVLPAIRRAAPRLAGLPRQWGHGDWHPSNLTWTSAASTADVAAVFDFGLANRTLAVHDLATALERSTVSWLGLAGSGRAAADLDAIDALLDGYQAVRPLSPAEAAALAEVFPVVHVEYALAEIEYFHSVVHSASHASLAYDGYLLGHAEWFAGPDGAAVLDRLRRRAGGPG